MFTRLRWVVLVVVSLAVLSCGSDNGTESDSTPPGVIADLVIAALSDSSMTLTWTAPGDDDQDGTASQYDIRYSPSTISEADWDSAFQASGEPAPQSAGAAESFEVTLTGTVVRVRLAAIDTDTTYYFAMKTADEAGNWSVLSNVASSTFEDDILPAAVADLSFSDVTDSAVTLTWTAPGDDGNFGQAVSYDIRWGTAAINETNWQSATQATGEPTPKTAGSTETFKIAILAVLKSAIGDAKAAEDETYYFALKTTDDEGNISALSNVPGTKLADLIAPGIVSDLEVESITESSVTLGWDAPGDDDYEGQAAAYDIRYATVPIDGANFSAATPVPSPPLPKTAGARETVTVTGLNAMTRYYFALKTRDDADNWSEPSNVVNAIPVANVVVAFPDANLEAAVRSAINQPSGDIMSHDLLNLKLLNADTRSIANLSGLEYCLNLRDLRIYNNQIGDLSPLSGLTGLVYLYADNNSITNLAPLSGLTKLEILRASDNDIADISGLATLTVLRELQLSRNPIASFTALSGLTTLTSLELGETGIADLSPLSPLVHLVRMNLNYNDITSVTALSGLADMEWLYMADNEISDIGALSGMTKLKVLALNRNNGISDISALSGMTQMLELAITDNNISDITPLNNMTKIYSLWLYNNNISNIATLANLTELTQLSLFGNPIASLTPLSGLTKLTRLFLYNTTTTDISALANLTALRDLDLGYNSISDIAALSGLTALEELSLYSNNVVDISVLSGLTALEVITLSSNPVVDLLPLVQNSGLGAGDGDGVTEVVNLYLCDQLSVESLNTHIPALEARGVVVNR